MRIINITACFVFTAALTFGNAQSNAVSNNRQDESTKVTATVTLPKDLESFTGLTLVLRLYEYDPLLADVSADLVEKIEKPDFSHTKGKPTVTKIEIGTKGRIKPRRSYYLTTFVLDGEQRTHIGEKDGKPELCKVITDGHPREVSVVVRVVSKTPAPKIRESVVCRSLEYAGVAVNEPGYHCWGTSPIMDDEGKVHLFVARWPIRSETFERGFDAAWRHDSEIAHYVGDGPEGPFAFSDVALKGTGKDTWDRYAPCNPLIKKVDGKYVLLHIANPVGMTKGMGRHPGTQRIGMALSDSLNGPWKKVGTDGKILDPSKERGHWTHRGSVVNPAFVKAPNGKYHLYFKSRGARMGVAISEKLEGPYVHQPNPISSSKRRTEDGYAFVSDGKFFLLTTDNHGVNVRGGGLLWRSDDGITFDATPEIGYQSPKTYLPRTPGTPVRKYYGSGTFQRPQVLLQNGRPTHLYAASGTNIKGGDGSLSYVLRCNYEKVENNEREI
ncbi:MAG: glycoside hydrolase family protein [Planctomycetota bacterium]